VKRPAPQNISTAVLSPTRLSKNARRLSLIQNLSRNMALSALRSRMQWRAGPWTARKPMTGVAGPEPDERGNPVGLVYLACARKAGSRVGVKREFGDIGRSRIRYQAASDALGLIARLSET